MERSRFEYTLLQQPIALLWQFCLALAVFLSGVIGWHIRSLVGHLAISFVWPIAGVALALIFLFGRRAVYGIFLGSLVYELFYPNRESIGFIYHLIGCLSVSFGQVLGAYLGAFLLKKFMNRGLFHSVSDSTSFLIFAGLLSTMIAPLFFMGMLSLDVHFNWHEFPEKWLQGWISNVSGVVLFAPFIIVWGRNSTWEWKPTIYLEGSLFFAGYLLITFLAAEVRFGFIYLYLPWAIWVLFRLGELGATLAILLFSISSVMLSELEDLTFVITFVDIIAVTILILLGALDEKTATQKELADYSENLESKIITFTKEQNRHGEKVIQNLAVNSLSVGIAHQLQSPIVKIVEYSGGAETCSNLIYHEFLKAKPALTEQSFSLIETNFKSLQTCLKNIKDGSVQAAHLLKIMNQQTSREKEAKKEFKPVDLHALLNSSLGRNLAKQAIIAPDLKINIVKKYSPRVPAVKAVSGDLDQMFYHVFDNAFFAIKEKWINLGKGYKPQLTVSTEDKGEFVEIVIEDNGIGIPPNLLFKIFQPFFTTKAPGTVSGIGLSISFEIVEKEHHGKIEVDSNEGEFTRVKILLPKER